MPQASIDRLPLIVQEANVEGVLNQRTGKEVVELADHDKGEEVHDNIYDCVVLAQHDNVDTLDDYDHCRLRQADHPCLSH